MGGDMAVISGEGRRLLLVEDEELISRPLAKVLERSGFHVTVAASIGDALECLDRTLTENPFRHVVLDLQLPDGDGETILNLCDELPERPSVIVVASPEGVDSRRMAAFSGRCDYLPKPLMFDTLIELLTREHIPRLSQYAEEFGLNEQEVEVLQSAVEGLDIEETARQLGCEPATVRSLWTRLAQKTSTSDREQTLAHVIRWLTKREGSTGRSRAPRGLPKNVLKFPISE
jgi:DNA-binding response OmpR family regulator